ncbi:hypothetical protein [Haladaptatus sp. DJG-WS-42]|uniref:hypothetical protein n=1 Tax=Haladaptatus sp. DJG-WS-42 TaxID=3120516 RepID=UPI0030CA699A
MTELHDATTFTLYYADADKQAPAVLADVRVPSYTATENDPTEFYYHETKSAEMVQMHQEYLMKIAYDAASDGMEKLSHPSGENLSIEHTGETTADGTALVHLNFDWDGRETPWAEYIAGSGYGVLTNENSRYADAIQAAQDWARENDEGLWKYNNTDDHPHE